MADLDLDAIASRPGDGAIFLANWERDALVAEVRRLRAIEDAARAWAAVTMYVAEGAHSYADAAGARRDLIAALEAERRG